MIKLSPGPSACNGEGIISLNGCISLGLSWLSSFFCTFFLGNLIYAYDFIGHTRMVKAPRSLTSLASYMSSPDILVIPVLLLRKAIILAQARSLYDVFLLCPSLSAARQVCLKVQGSAVGIR